MKIIIPVSLLIVLLVAVSNANSSQNERNKSYKNLAVMLAYKPNSEITTKDERNKKWTYKINHAQSDENSGEELNKKLMNFLKQQKLAKYFDDKTTVKRDNRDATAVVSSSSSMCEASNEDNIADAKIVQKHSCYNDTYENVLGAFEEALKSQIRSYKKCVCQQKTTTSTTSTTTTTTTEAPKENNNNNRLNTVGQRGIDDDNDSDETAPSGTSIEKELVSASKHPDDIICFHKQYAFMLNKLLDYIPCERKSEVKNLPSSIEDYNGVKIVRNERNNVPISNESLESIELDVSSIETQRAVSKKADSETDLRELILAALKEHLNAKKESINKKKTTTTTTTTLSPDSEEEDIVNETEFLEKLKKLFQELENEEKSFPMSNGKSYDERTTSMSSQKSSSKKSKTFNEITNDFRKNKQQLGRKTRKSQYGNSLVSEDSNESTETSIKLKNSRVEKQHNKVKENLRENSKNHFTSALAAIKNSSSYRTASRSSANADIKKHRNSIEEKETENTKMFTENSSTYDDDRLARDLAKTISDYARKYMRA
ncbi:hypothetical protein PVAND_014121 [Polypedilum vanderplanki]|uniref:Uncharacterized protein n=1 Tax=Polypedilum vanderplanki TaxID=319348 RepID=A0A9J6CSQ9_POLVA|nr:hypothetical protein PVAND_014121 [Polypedilum vanderplanki]